MSDELYKYFLIVKEPNGEVLATNHRTVAEAIAFGKLSIKEGSDDFHIETGTQIPKIIYSLQDGAVGDVPF